MSCPECGWPEPYGRCACCGFFIRPVYFQNPACEFASDEDEETDVLEEEPDEIPAAGDVQTGAPDSFAEQEAGHDL
jgi:hypothetical protein